MQGTLPSKSLVSHFILSIANDKIMLRLYFVILLSVLTIICLFIFIVWHIFFSIKEENFYFVKFVCKNFC